MGATETGIRTVEVHAIDVRWSDGYANDPSLRILASGLEGRLGKVYEKRAIPGVKGWHVYWSRVDDFAWFFTWAGKPDDGFGGYRRTVRLTDGAEEVVVGGWHTTADIATSAGFPPLVEVALVHAESVGPGDWTRRGGTSCFVVRGRMERELAEHRPDLVWHPGWDERACPTVGWRGQPSKAEHIARRTGVPYSSLGAAA